MEDRQQLQKGRSGGTVSLNLPPGFRFHPSDEEIITCYLTHKVRDYNFTAIAIGEVDINKSEPWELPSKAKMGEKEWYFYCLKDRKYPTGLKANRATEAGYWKATGKDREIYHSASNVPMLIGMKKTLVFYKGRAPKGVKTNWVMHEYRLDGKGRVPCPATNSNTKSKKPCSSSKVEEWVVCRVFDKSLGIRKELESAPVSAPPYRTTMSGGGIDPRSMSFTMPIQSLVGTQGFTMNSNGLHPLMGDPSSSFYSTDGIGSSVPPLLLSPLLPMAGMDSIRLQVNNEYLGNPTALTELVSFCEQVVTETTSDCGFLAEPDIRLTSMLMQDVRVSPGQADAAHISSVVNPGHVASSTVDMDNFLKYILEN
ncbi:hypothetical protein EJB05_51311, partial [Eragrostis curvula]